VQEAHGERLELKELELEEQEGTQRQEERLQPANQWPLEEGGRGLSAQWPEQLALRALVHLPSKI
jgi:hypothetical protein